MTILDPKTGLSVTIDVRPNTGRPRAWPHTGRSTTVVMETGDAAMLDKGDEL